VTSTEERHHASRTGSKVVLLLVGLLFSAGVYPLSGFLIHPNRSDTGDAMMLSLSVAESVGASQPDTLRRVVNLCSCRDHVDAGNSGPAFRFSNRVGCAGCHRSSPNRPGCGETDGRAGIGAPRCRPWSEIDFPQRYLLGGAAIPSGGSSAAVHFDPAQESAARHTILMDETSGNFTGKLFCCSCCPAPLRAASPS